MNGFVSFLSAVVNSMWQAALVAAAVWLALRRARQVNAATRFAIWWAVLAVVLVLPMAPWLLSSVRESLRPVTIASAKPLYPPPPGQVSVIDLTPLISIPESSARTWPVWVAAAWVMFFLHRFAQLLRSYVHLCRLKRNASASPELRSLSRRPAPILLSSAVDSPVAVGFG